VGERLHERLRDTFHVDAPQDRRGDLRDLHGALVFARGLVLANVARGAQRLQRAMDVAPREAHLAGEVGHAARRLALRERLEHVQAFYESLVHVL
jgi:hypothetical protein